MNIKCVLGGAAVVFAFSVAAGAQLIAGSPEDELFGRITASTNPDEKLDLIRQFEGQYPDVPDGVFLSLYTMALTVSTEKNDMAGIVTYGQKILERDSENVNALMTLSRSLAVARQDLPKALEYAERAVSIAERMKGEPPPDQSTQAEWDQRVSATETSARGILAYVRSVSP
jgi:hypothetical protein